MSQPTLNEKAAALIEELTVMADLHGGNGDTAAAEEFSEWVDVVRDLVAELDCPHRLARHSKRLIEQQRAEIEALRKDSARLDRLDQEREAYGTSFHEGNRWTLDGQFATVRDAIDAAMGKGEQP